MYSYSPIKEIQIRNFRNIGDVTLDFNDSPIITLIGENESGKTSCVKAFGVCAMHQNARGQKDYIRDGTNGFGVAIILQDGTQVIRLKTTTRHTYQVKKPDGTTWTADKLDNTVPLAVQEVMGLIEEPETKELLQIRTYEDQLLFVVTPSSTNYKVMYDALKISNITRAIKIGSKEANELKAAISSSDANIDAFRRSINAIKIFDIEPLLNLREHIKTNRDILNKLASAIQIKDSIEKARTRLGALSLLDKENVQLIDEAEAFRLNNVSRLLENISKAKIELSKYSEILAAEQIDESVVSNVVSAYSRKQIIDDMQKRNRAYIELSNVEDIDELVISRFEDARSTIDKLNRDRGRLKIYEDNNLEELSDTALSNLNKIETVIKYRDSINNGNQVIKQYSDYIDQIVEYLKSLGVATTDCPRCGESIVIDLDLINSQT